jgi:hypothetical protein
VVGDYKSLTSIPYNISVPQLKTVINKMKKIAIVLVLCAVGNCHAGNNNNQNNSDTIYNTGDTYNTTNAYNQPSAYGQGGTGIGYGGTGVGYGGNSYGYNNQGQSQGQSSYNNADSSSRSNSSANAGSISASGVDSDISSTNRNQSSAANTVSSSPTINDNRSEKTVFPRQAPPATAPSMTGAMGTDSVSGGFSTPLGGVSFGRSKTTAEATALLRAQKTSVDLANLATVSSCDGMYEEDCARIRKQIMRGYGR